MKTKLILWLLLLVALPAGATQVKGADRLVINEPQVEDCYLAGRSVSIEAPVRGDLMVAASDLWIRDTVTGDVQLAAGNAVIEAPLMDDLRVLSGKIRIDNTVDGDIFIMGGEVELTSRAFVGGDIYLMGGSLILDGTALGNVKLYGGKVELNGQVEKMLLVRGGDAVINGAVRGNSSLAATHLQLGEKAAFYAPVRYWTKAGTLDFGSSMKNGEAAVYDEALAEKVNAWTEGDGNAAWAGFWLWRLAAAALSIVVLIALFGRYFRSVGQTFTNERIGHYMGLGLLLVLLTPLIAGLAFVTVIGIPLALTLTLLFTLLLAFAHVITAVVGAYVWRDYTHADWSPGRLMLAAFGLYVALKVVGWIPFLGWVVSILAVLTTFGVLVQAVRNSRRPPVEPVVPRPEPVEELV